MWMSTSLSCGSEVLVVVVSVLGELEVSVDGAVLALPRGLARSLLMSLVVDLDRPIPDDDLIERLWGEAAPANAHFSLRNTVSRLRSLLGHDVIGRDSVGYRMSSAAVHTDIAELAEALAACDTLSPDQQAERVEAALRLVRGPAFAAVRNEWWAARAVAAADEQVAAAEERWADLRLANGQVGGDLGRFRAQALDKPMRETRWRQLVDALVLDARRAEALRAAHEARRALAEFGLSVGPELREAERRALIESGDGPSTLTPGAAALEAARAWPMVGRGAVLRSLSASPSAAPVSWIVGSSGSGVSRTLAEMAALVRGGGVLVCAVDVEAAGRGHRMLDALGAEFRAARLLLSSAVETEAELSESSPMPEVREARIRSELAKAMADIAGHSRLLVVLDDVQLLSTSDARVVAHLVRVARENDLDVAFVCGEEVDVVGSGVLRCALADELGELEPDDATLRLGPLEVGDVVDLVDELRPGLPTGEARRLAEAVVGATLGHPLSTAELVRHQLIVGSDAPLPVSLEDAIQARLSRLGNAAVDVVRVVAAAGRPVGAAVVAEATPATRAAARSAIQRLLDERLLVELDGGRLEIRMAQLEAAALRSLSWSEVTRIRRRLVDLLEAQHDDQPLLVHLLLGMRTGGSKHDHRLDTLVRDLLDRHVQATDFESAVVLARHYLSAVGAVDAHDALGLEIRVLIATALFATGAAAEANSLVELVAARAEVLDLPELVADALLARGPIDTGSSDAEHIAQRAAAVLPQLAANDVERRVRLSCWAAHHLFNLGQYDRAVAMLDAVEADVNAAARPLWKSLLLTMRVQQQMCLEGRPRLASKALDELSAWHRLTGDESAGIGSATMGLAVASCTGSFDDVRAAAEAIRAAGRTMPRPDLRWLPEAANAAVLLATGDVVAAETAMGAAESLGERLSVSGARGAAISQRLLLMLEGGSLGSMAPLMAPFAGSTEVPAALIGAWGLACVQAADRESAAQAGQILRATGSVLRGVGAGWPLVAMCAAEVAASTSDAELGRIVFDELRTWTGAGLAVYGLVHVGPADLWLGLCASVMGQRATAERLLDDAIAQERRRGGAYWEKRALLARERLDGNP